MQSLPEILGFEKRILGENRRPIRVRSKQFQNTADRNPHTANARLAAALPRLNRYPVKQIYRGHEPSLDYPWTSVDSWGRVAFSQTSIHCSARFLGILNHPAPALCYSYAASSNLTTIRLPSTASAA